MYREKDAGDGTVRPKERRRLMTAGSGSDMLEVGGTEEDAVDRKK